MPIDRFTSLSSSLVLAIALSACGGGKEKDMSAADEKEMPAEDTAMASEPMADEMPDMADDMPAPTSLADVLSNEEIRGESMARDEFRNPAETLAFFGLEPDMTVVEVFPGGGWYTNILAPYLKSGGGTLYAANFDPAAGDFQQRAVTRFTERYINNPDVYGDVRLTVLSGDSTDGIAPAESADLVLTFRNMHSLIGGGIEAKAFADAYAALKPGGILGVVAHRLPEDFETDERARGGYVKESTVIAVAEAAGFELADRSEINANAADDADHPFGVWTLPPISRGPRDGEEAPEGFDPEAYKAIGESDRMTLKFQKPAADAALLE